MFDENGKLIIKTLEENIEEYKDKYEESFGSVDIAPSSALGSDLAITAEMKKNSDEFIQYAYAQNSPYEAIEKGLENLCFLRGIKKKINEHSVCLVKFLGTDGTVIEKGTVIKEVTTEEPFTTNEKGIITNGSFTVFVTAVNAGRVACKTNTLTVLDPEIEGVTVSNPTDGIYGFLTESDTDLRTRLHTYSNGLNIDEKIELELMNLKNVKFVNVVSNPELTTDQNGVTAKATSIVVLGGENKEIAQKIYSIFPADKKTIGSVSEVITSSVSNKEYIVKFSRPKAIPVTVEVNIFKDQTFNPENVGVIKSSILNFFSKSFKIADDVLIDSLYIPVQQDFNDNNSLFKGIKNVTISLNNGSENIAIKYDEFASLSSFDLSIIVQEG